MMKHEETYTSQLHTHVHYMVYEPKVVLRIKGIVFMQHDMGEDLRTYQHFANFLSNHGYVAVVSDIVGHGRSLIDFEQGFFGQGEVLEGLIQDMYHLQEILMSRYSEALCFYIGIGFGTSLTRIYASLYGDYFQGMLLISPTYNVKFERFGNLRLALKSMVKGERYHPVKRVDKVKKRYSKRFSEKLFDWLTSDKKQQELYKQDTMNNFAYTIKGYQDILKIERKSNVREVIEKTSHYLSILIMYGKEDPINRYGKDAHKIYLNYKNNNIDDLEIKEYKESRHNLLKDVNKEDVYLEILNWLNKRTFY